jgi:hypothetical protein
VPAGLLTVPTLTSFDGVSEPVDEDDAEMALLDAAAAQAAHVQQRRVVNELFMQLRRELRWERLALSTRTRSCAAASPRVSGKVGIPIPG